MADLTGIDLGIVRFENQPAMLLQCRTDGDGRAHGAQVHPDGSADFVQYKPDELPIAVRWMSRTGDQDALGIILPSTSGVEGYTAEKSKGRVVTIAARGIFSCQYRCGTLDPSGTMELLRRIESIVESDKRMTASEVR